MDVWVITGEVDYEGSAVLGVAASFEAAEALLQAYCAQHDITAVPETSYDEVRVYDVRRGDNFDVGYDGFLIFQVPVDAPLMRYW